MHFAGSKNALHFVDIIVAPYKKSCAVLAWVSMCTFWETGIAEASMTCPPNVSPTSAGMFVG